MDQRVQKTYSALQASMRELLGNSSWDEITVQSLCETAQVSRTTFYSHFEHKDDLLTSLLHEFESAMLSDNNARSLSGTGTFKFLPMLLNHVNGNRQLFANTNTSAEGYPVATKFSNLIDRLVAAECTEASSTVNVQETKQHFIAGGIYSALVKWSSNTEDQTHLTLLSDLDDNIKHCL